MSIIFAVIIIILPFGRRVWLSQSLRVIFTEFPSGPRDEVAVSDVNVVFRLSGNFAAMRMT